MTDPLNACPFSNTFAFCILILHNAWNLTEVNKLLVGKGFLLSMHKEITDFLSKFLIDNYGFKISHRYNYLYMLMKKKKDV